MNANIFADLLLDHYGGMEAFLVRQSGISPDRIRWAVQHGDRQIPMPSYGHADQLAVSSGGTVAIWSGDVRSHAEALRKLCDNVEPDALAWLSGGAS